MAKRVSVKGRGADLFFGDSPNERTNERPDERTNEPPAAPPIGLSSERTNERTAAVKPPPVGGRPRARREPPRERTNERTAVEALAPLSVVQRVRHSFDVRRDQLLELTAIQIDVFRGTGRKPTMGELVQEALDEYIRARRKRAARATD